MFYDKYEELCRKRGISPFAAARHLGISSRTQGNWKKGSAPRFGTLLKIAEYFNVDMSYFDDEITNDDDEITDAIKDTPLVQEFIDEMKKKNALTDDEQLLLDMFRSMTDEQKTALMKEAMRIKLK